MLENCGTILIVLIGGAFFLAALLLVLLALPRSRLRSFLLEVLSWATAGASAILIVSPIDLIPFVPLEDPLYWVTLVAGSASGIFTHRERNRLEASKD